MKHTVLIHVVKDGKAHGGRDHLDGRAPASLADRGEASDHVGGACAGRYGRGRRRSQWRVPLAALCVAATGSRGQAARDLDERPGRRYRSFPCGSGPTRTRQRRRRRAILRRSRRHHLARLHPHARSPAGDGRGRAHQRPDRQGRREHRSRRVRASPCRGR